MGLLDGIQSALNPHSPDAAAIASLAWVLVGGGALVFAATMGLVAYAVRARPAWLARRSAIVLGGIAFPAVVVLALLLYSLVQAAAIVEGGPAALRIEVVAQQWWWRVRYLDAAGRPEFETANEIHLPVGQRVELVLSSDDVLHSVWVPNLAGKLDTIPGRINRLHLAANRIGVFRGQCAEYCGGPHAQMALYVVAESVEDFEQWRLLQHKPAGTVNHAFTSYCAVCHTVRGTEARGMLGPDLTHLGSRRSIAAGTLPNDADALARWIASSQHVKPGNLMPSFPMLSADELDAIVAYLVALK